MPALADDVLEPMVPTPEQSRIAQASSRKLGPLTKTIGNRLRIKVQDVPNQDEILELPEPVVQMLLKILVHVAKGEAVAIVPSNKVLSTNEAADILNVSRPFLIGLLESGKIDHHMVGTHRRVLFRDLMDYKRKMHQERMNALDEMAELSQELG